MIKRSEQKLGHETASKLRLFAYSGLSMNPTFSQEDLLGVKKEKMVRSGDVVFFRSGGKFIVHRAMAVTPHSIVTRGDNNPANDIKPVRPDDVVGIVVAAWRGNRRRAIHGGRSGILVARWLHCRRRIWARAVALLSRPYRNLEQSGLLRPLAAPLCPRVIKCGECMHLLLAEHVVGSFKPGGKWLIKHPWDLFVDAGRLPRQVPRQVEPRCRDLGEGEALDKVARRRT